MKALEAQRKLYLKKVEEAGNVQVLDMVNELENKMRNLDPIKCREELRKRYINNGSFQTTYEYGNCSTQPVSGLHSNSARVKEYFEQRNPLAYVDCRQYGKHDRSAECVAKLRPEPLFEKE